MRPSLTADSLRQAPEKPDSLSLSSPKCILVVDDEESIRDVIGETLELEGYRVAKAADGRAALILIKASARTRSCST